MQRNFSEIAFPDVRSIPQLGCYFAGLVDGEGCFYIATNRCEFIIKMRADDRPLLERLRDQFGGLGSLRIEAGGGNSSNRNRRPQIRWTISAKRELIWLTDLFDVYQLQSKKSRDYAIWREAVVEWFNGAPDFERYRTELKAVREYA